MGGGLLIHPHLFAQTDFICFISVTTFSVAPHTLVCSLLFSKRSARIPTETLRLAKNEDSTRRFFTKVSPRLTADEPVRLARHRRRGRVARTDRPTRFVSNYDLGKLPGRERAHAAAKLFRDHVSRVLLFEFSYANTPTHGSSGRRLHRCRLLLPVSADSERQSVFRLPAWRLPPLRDPGTADRSRHRSIPTNRLMGEKFRRRTRLRRRLYAYSTLLQTVEGLCPSNTHDRADGIPDERISEIPQAPERIGRGTPSDHQNIRV